MSGEVVTFWVFSVIAVGAAIAMISMRNVVHAALMLVVNLLAVAGLFLVLQSPFLAVIQVIVYGGAIMVLFLFVIMLLGVRRDDLLVTRDRAARLGAWALAAALVVAVSVVFVGPYTGPASVCGAEPGAATGVRGVVCVGLDAIFEHRDGSVLFAARVLFGRYVFAFEFVALILVVATIAALLIGRRGDHADPDAPAAVPAGPTPSDLGATALESPPHDTGVTEGDGSSRTLAGTGEHGTVRGDDTDPTGGGGA